MSGVALVLAILVALIIIVAMFAVGTFNKLVALKNRYENAFAQIEVQLKRRHDLIPNLVETVKGYATHEKGVFEEVTRARSTLQNASGPAESTSANQMLTAALGRLFAVVENYPELKAASNFQDLQDELSDVEVKIAYARQFFNRNVAQFNIRIRSIPDILIARMLGLERFEFFEEDEDADEELQVSFASSSGE